MAKKAKKPKVSKNEGQTVGEKITALFKTIGVIQGGLSGLLIWLGTICPAWITTSPSYQSALSSGVIIGGLIGLGFSVLLRKFSMMLFVALLFGSIVSFAVVTFVVNPSSAFEQAWLQSIQDSLIVNPSVFFLLMGSFAGVFACSIVWFASRTVRTLLESKKR